MNALNQILAYFSKIMADLMIYFHSGLGISWGLSIVLLTFVVKMVLFPTTIRQARSMEGMKKIQPLLKEIQEKYKDKPDEYQRRMLEVYKSNNVSPFGGCLPLLLQLPFIWALFLLLQAPTKFGIDLTGAKFFWIGLMDTGQIYSNGILAAVSALTTYWQQKITSPAGDDPTQKGMMYFIPGLMAVFTFSVSAGLGVYWVTSNIIGIIQQYIILRYFIKKEEAKSAK